jgi:hypothetical protein
MNIVEALKENLAADLKAVYYKSQTTLPGKDREALGDEYLLG